MKENDKHAYSLIIRQKCDHLNFNVAAKKKKKNKRKGGKKRKSVKLSAKKPK